MRLSNLRIIISLLITPVVIFTQTVNDTLAVLYSFDAPSLNIQSLTVRDSQLLLLDFEISYLYLFSLEGELLDSFDLSITNPRGITWHGDDLWLADDSLYSDSLKYLLKIDPSNGEILDSLSYSGYAISTQRFGMTSIDSSLLISYDGGWGSCLFEFDLRNGDFDKHLCCPHPIGMTTHNDTIWSVRQTSYQSGNLIVPLLVVGSDAIELWSQGFYIDFQTTGIAFDGEYFWINDLENQRICKMIPYSIVGLGENAPLLPKVISIFQNYPNPFNPITTIQYELPQRTDVKIAIYDLLGREVTTLLSETQEAGYKSVQWNASNVPNGMYFYQIRAGEHVQTRKMVLLK